MTAPDPLTPFVRSLLQDGTRPLSEDIRSRVLERLPTLRQVRAGRPLHGPFFQARRLISPRILGALSVLLTMLALAAVALGVGQQPTPALTFAPGSLAFTRDDDLYLAGPDGKVPVKVELDGLADGAVRRFAFSPDRSHLAVEVQPDQDGNSTLTILNADLSVSGSIAGGLTNYGLAFGWSPDGQRLAIFPGDTDREIGLLDTGAHRIGSLALPAQTMVTTRFWQEFAELAWSPDGRWLALPVHDDGDGCSVAAREETCYLLLATDGSGTRGLSDHSTGYLAWAPDGRVALTHWPDATIDVWPTDLSAPRVIPLPAGMKPMDGHVLAWSPDGTNLAVVLWTPATQEFGVSLIGPAGVLTPVSLTSSTGLPSVSWSPDGQRLFFLAELSGSDRSGISSVPATGGVPRLLTMADQAFDVAGATR